MVFIEIGSTAQSLSSVQLLIKEAMIILYCIYNVCVPFCLAFAKKHAEQEFSKICNPNRKGFIFGIVSCLLSGIGISVS